eukprot:CAMPEP_0194781956 /NCGR_PEP_ID=MMETSP0323_2-20130528/77717_1 /TAXON_ID=2866 ORGANISM="Crypthecodinium cohnii, Strain Seligo" /NCGR_SAMPLE_ID=MMETSP0323_2 /ASSEMBLY_ACC=CAM_ASM_000346 /LENGTH=64 /DNA_ID=CAMNT_0039720603 /DNA_START=10 /DNA_END=201 /DNA_ORIENTATION=-
MDQQIVVRIVCNISIEFQEGPRCLQDFDYKVDDGCDQVQDLRQAALVPSLQFEKVHGEEHYHVG